MRPHIWSHPVVVYELFCGFRCQNCDAVCFALHEGPGTDDLRQQSDGPIPEDCDEATSLVRAGRFAWDQKDMPPWNTEDVGRWSWPTQRVLTHELTPEEAAGIDVLDPEGTAFVEVMLAHVGDKDKDTD